MEPLDLADLVLVMVRRRIVQVMRPALFAPRQATVKQMGFKESPNTWHRSEYNEVRTRRYSELTVGWWVGQVIRITMGMAGA